MTGHDDSVHSRRGSFWACESKPKWTDRPPSCPAHRSTSYCTLLYRPTGRVDTVRFTAVYYGGATPVAPCLSLRYDAPRGDQPTPVGSPPTARGPLSNAETHSIPYCTALSGACVGLLGRILNGSGEGSAAHIIAGQAANRAASPGQRIQGPWAREGRPRDEGAPAGPPVGWSRPLPSPTVHSDIQYTRCQWIQCTSSPRYCTPPSPGTQVSGTFTPAAARLRPEGKRPLYFTLF